MQQIIETLNRWLKAVIVTLVAATAGIVILNVCSRYFFQMSLSWSAELARYMMVWIAFLGAAVLVDGNRHLKVDLWRKSISKKARLIRDTFIAGISLLFFGAITVFGFKLVVLSGGQAASSITWLPMGAVYAVIPFSGFLMVLAAVLRIRNLFAMETTE